VQELDEPQEVLFVMQGNYDVGYELNKKCYMRRKFGPSTLIGAFEMSF